MTFTRLPIILGKATSSVRSNLGKKEAVWQGSFLSLAPPLQALILTLVCPPTPSPHACVVLFFS